MIDASWLVLWMTKSHYYFEIGEVNIGEVVHLFFHYVYMIPHIQQSTIKLKIYILVAYVGMVLQWKGKVE